jgi:hypothetical protein
LAVLRQLPCGGFGTSWIEPFLHLLRGINNASRRAWAPRSSRCSSTSTDCAVVYFWEVDVAGSNPVTPTIDFMVYSRDMGNTLAPKGFSAHSTRSAPRRRTLPGSILQAVKNRKQNVLKTAQPQQAMSGDYLGGRAALRFEVTPLRCLVTGFVVSAASNNCRSPCAKSSTAFPKAPSCPTRTIATDRCRSNDGGRNTFTGSIERFLAIKRAGSSPTP